MEQHYPNLNCYCDNCWAYFYDPDREPIHKDSNIKIYKTSEWRGKSKLRVEVNHSKKECDFIVDKGNGSGLYVTLTTKQIQNLIKYLIKQIFKFK